MLAVKKSRGRRNALTALAKVAEGGSRNVGFDLAARVTDLVPLIKDQLDGPHIIGR